MSDDRTERVQRGLGIFSSMMRPPLRGFGDEKATAAIAAHVESQGRELAALGLDAGELDEVQALYFQGVDAARGFEREQFAKMAYLAKHSPGKTVGEAIASLTPEQLDEYTNLTADYLDVLIGEVAATDLVVEIAAEVAQLAPSEVDEYKAARGELLDRLDAAQGTTPVSYAQFQQALKAGADCSTLFELRNRMDPKDPLKLKANEDLRSIGCFTRQSSREA